ncbi:TetR family transcriptional regulator [Pseudoduganella sp. FT93W]|uniref:TetR family transcriptional regulator n=2 Tax=Duganella fentianensis TaxID=2692177 RepID=A0A845I0Z1_9BURK|nr:TetR family transcriptional regulator [Duganella fentianensis]
MTSAKEPAEKPTRKKRNTVPAVASEVATAGLRAQGLRTRNAIVAVARTVLLEGGSLEFSLREVAARAGISISNLQYYFPTRLSVLRAVIEPQIEAYLVELRAAFNSGAPARETLEGLAVRSLREAKDAEATALWWHFVSFAVIDPECSRLLDEWYETLTNEVAHVIRRAYPHYTAADCLHRATLLIALADGINFQLGAGRRKRHYTRGLDAKFRAAAECILGDSLLT